MTGLMLVGIKTACRSGPWTESVGTSFMHNAYLGPAAKLTNTISLAICASAHSSTYISEVYVIANTVSDHELLCLSNAI